MRGFQKGITLDLLSIQHSGTYILLSYWSIASITLFLLSISNIAFYFLITQASDNTDTDWSRIGDNMMEALSLCLENRYVKDKPIIEHM